MVLSIQAYVKSIVKAYLLHPFNFNTQKNLNRLVQLQKLMMEQVPKNLGDWLKSTN